MNKKRDCQNRSPAPRRVAARAGRAERPLRARVPVAAAAATGSLPRDAERLLAALVAREGEAFADPTDAGMVIVRSRRAAVSVGAGRFPVAAAQALARHDLASWREAEPGRLLLRATAAGRAHRRRRSAGEGEAPFLHQHLETRIASVETDTGPVRVRVDVEESPLDWLRRRKGRDGEPLIDAAEHAAGERLRRDVTLAGLLPGVTARWDAPRGGGPVGPADATDRMVTARQRVRDALAAVGADFADLLLDLCGFLKGLEVIERERRWPPRSAKVVVRLALSRLAEHYGLSSTARGPAASRGIRTWQAVVIEGGRA